MVDKENNTTCNFLKGISQFLISVFISSLYYKCMSIYEGWYPII